MVFQKTRGAAAKRNFPQMNEKVPKKKPFEAEEDDDDESDDDIDMEDSDFDDSDSDDASDSGGAKGRLNAKGKQTPTQGKGSPFVKTPKGQQAQAPAVSSGKKNQLHLPTFLQMQNKMELPGPKGQTKRKMLDKEAVEGEEDSDDDDDDDDDDDTSDSGGDAPGKLNTKGKQTPSQGKNTSLVKTPRGQAQTPAVSSGKKNQLVTPLQKQTKQNVMKEFPGMKGSAGKGKIMGKAGEDDDDDDDDDSEDDDDDDDDSDEVSTKAPALNKSAGKKTPNGKKDMHVSFELPKKGGSPVKTPQSQQKLQAVAKKNQQAAAVPGAQQGKSAKGTPGKATQKGMKKQEESDDDDEDDDLSDDDDVEGSDDDDDDDDEDDDADSDDEEAIKKKLASLKKEMIPKKDNKSLNESSTKSQDPKSKKAKTLLPNSKEEPKTNKAVQNKAFQESYDKELERKRERDARNLFIRGLPLDVTVDEIKALSPDILDVSIPKSKFQKRKGNKTVFGFLEFANEKKAEENYVKLQKKKLRDQDIFVDFSGEKSKNKNVAAAGSTVNEKNINKKKLFVSGLPVDVTMVEVAELFPSCYTITVNHAPEYRNCNASFHTEEDAAAAFKANESAKVRGRAVTVLFAVEQKNQQQFKRKRPHFEKNKFSPSNKKMRQEKM